MVHGGFELHLLTTNIDSDWGQWAKTFSGRANPLWRPSGVPLALLAGFWDLEGHPLWS